MLCKKLSCYCLFSSCQSVFPIHKTPSWLLSTETALLTFRCFSDRWKVRKKTTYNMSAYVDIVASNHLAVRHLMTETVSRLVGINRHVKYVWSVIGCEGVRRTEECGSHCGVLFSSDINRHNTTTPLQVSKTSHNTTTPLQKRHVVSLQLASISRWSRVELS